MAKPVFNSKRGEWQLAKNIYKNTVLIIIFWWFVIGPKFYTQVEEYCIYWISINHHDYNKSPQLGDLGEIFFLQSFWKIILISSVIAKTILGLDDNSWRILKQ